MTYPIKANSVSAIDSVKVSTIGGQYTVGDTRTKPTENIKIASDDFDKWQTGFDMIDIAPKDGVLSLNEICDYRDKQVIRIKSSFYKNPTNWNIKKMVNFSIKMDYYEKQTNRYRNGQ